MHKTKVGRVISGPDFSEKTKQTLAKRAGQVCSNPDCRSTTSGPHSAEDKAVNLGEAAHIKAARQGQARFEPTMTDEQRCHISNGIWLCRTCARKIDLDEAKYPVALLLQWKTKHEKWISSGKPEEGDRKVVICDHSTERGLCPLELVAFSFKEPHHTDAEFAGIKWKENYVDVRVLLTNKGTKTIQDLNLAIQPETQIHDIRQVTQIPDVVLQPRTGPIQIAGAKIVVVDEKGNKTSIPVSFSGPGVSCPSYNLLCTRLQSNSKIEIVMACVAINPMEKNGGFPQQLYAKRREPQWVRIYGSYEVHDTKGAVNYQTRLQLPLNS